MTTRQRVTQSDVDEARAAARQAYWEAEAACQEAAAHAYRRLGRRAARRRMRFVRLALGFAAFIGAVFTVAHAQGHPMLSGAIGLVCGLYIGHRLMVLCDLEGA